MAARILLMLLLLIPHTVQAADAAPEGLVSSAFRMLAGLALVLGLVYVLYALSKRGAGWLPGTRSGLIQVREMRPLGPRKTLCLVKVHGQEFLLGVGERIEVLARFDAPAGGDFSETLKQQMGEPS